MIGWKSIIIWCFFFYNSHFLSLKKLDIKCLSLGVIIRVVPKSVVEKCWHTLFKFIKYKEHLLSSIALPTNKEATFTTFLPKEKAWRPIYSNQDSGIGVNENSLSSDKPEMCNIQVRLRENNCYTNLETVEIILFRFLYYRLITCVRSKWQPLLYSFQGQWTIRLCYWVWFNVLL